MIERLARFTYRELQKCAEREVALRRRVYAKQGTTKARARELSMMVEIAELLKDMGDEEDEGHEMFPLNPEA